MAASSWEVKIWCPKGMEKTLVTWSSALLLSFSYVRMCMCKWESNTYSEQLVLKSGG